MNQPTQSEPQNTNTGGGAHIDGNVETNADFVGRDKITNIYHVVPPPVTPESEKRPADHKHRTLLLFAGAGMVALLIAASLLYYLKRELPVVCNDSRHCVLVAAFDPDDDLLAAEIAGRIFDELGNNSLLPNGQFNIQQIPAILNADEAQAWAARNNAQIVIWGRLYPQLKELKINFTLTNRLGVGDSNQLRPYRVQFFEPVAQNLSCAGNCFDTEKLRLIANQLSVAIAHLSAGLLHYGFDQPEEAEADFAVALRCIGVDEATQLALNLPPVCAQPLAVEGFQSTALYYYAGKAKILTGDYRNALRYLELAIAENRADPAPYIALATLYRSWLDQERIPEAERALTAAVRLANLLRVELTNRNATAAELAPVDYELGFIAELQGEWARAAEQYQQAIDEFGAESQRAYVTYLALARVQRSNEEVDAAISTLAMASALDPSVPWAFLELAKLNRTDRDTAEANLRVAKEMAPNQAYVDIVEAELCTAWAAYDCAETAYQRALAKRPNSGWLFGRIGEFYQPGEPPLAHQDWAKAADSYQEAALRRPGDPWAYERLAFALFYQGNYPDAAAQMAHSVHDLSHPQSQVAARYCTLAQMQIAASEFEDALSNAQLCLERWPNTEDRVPVQALVAQIEGMINSQP